MTIDRRPELLALVEKKGKPLHLYALGMEHRKHGDAALALAAFAQTLEKDAAYHPACFMAAQVHHEEGANAAAAAALQNGIRIAEREGDAHAADEMRGFLDEIGDSA